MAPFSLHNIVTLLEPVDSSCFLDVAWQLVPRSRWFQGHGSFTPDTVRCVAFTARRRIHITRSRVAICVTLHGGAVPRRAAPYGSASGVNEP